MYVNPDNSLKSFNSFGIEAQARSVIHIFDEQDIFNALSRQLSPIKILGGGTNILLTQDQDATLLKNEIKGLHIIEEDENQVLVEVGSGEVWHQLVLWSISHQLGGLENLSLIPGTTGAAPMQNIGAYGVEQESVFHSLKAIHLETGVERIFYTEDCKFGYRESVFKNDLKDQYFITRVRYLLSKKNYVLNTSYGAISSVLASKNITRPGIKDVSDAVIQIRESKLPDPLKIGNAGSFFKNPVISELKFQILKQKFSDLIYYVQADGTVKIPAGWMIEKAGFKGKQKNNAGVHQDQALVLVNLGGANGSEILALAQEIQSTIKTMFDIELQPEVNIW